MRDRSATYSASYCCLSFSCLLLPSYFKYLYLAIGLHLHINLHLSNICLSTYMCLAT